MNWLRVACEQLDCSLDFSNPESLVWGSVENGTFSGHYKDLSDKKVDLITGGNIPTFSRSLVRMKFQCIFLAVVKPSNLLVRHFFNCYVLGWSYFFVSQA